MAYTPTPWRSNETALSAANMNHIEEGIREAHVLAEAAKAITDDIFNRIYPVGSIYISASSANPGLTFGGTWVQIKDKFLLARGDTYTSDQPGGSATHTHTTGNHTLTLAEIPAHNHGSKSLTGQFELRAHTTASWLASGVSGIISDSQDSSDTYKSTSESSNSRPRQKITVNATHTHNSQGGGGAHNHGNTGSANNMPPYLPVFVWQRTA